MATQRPVPTRMIPPPSSRPPRPTPAGGVAKRSAADEAYIAMLEDAVVGAAVLWFGEKPAGGPDQGYLSECLHLTASQIVNTVPRLKGAYKGGRR